ncbi:MAG TPA: amidase [Bryobacteraceae bacterium]|jgi:aspartyl-tRNA(Asn)/glutamyl-tRNA(Gln) amidotransferase subunit A|nr:amidase [Bryobacteraceae bacterium]
MAASIPDDIFFASITEINQKLKAKEFSAVELAKAFCGRLEQLGPRYNALALSLRDKAVKAAKDVDGDLKRERYRGPLQGIPFGAKDLLAYAKHPTTWGAKPYAGQVFDYDATVLKKLIKGGGILAGKLAMVELAGGPSYRYASASLTGPGLNPWDPTRWSGGSSSGSGIAVAAGLVTYALGSETSGSILTPAAFCGVTGLRPTYGLVSRHGAMALSWTLDKIGPLCRSAEDCGLVLHEIAGADGEDPASAGKSFYYAPQFARDLKEVKVGFAPIDFAEWADPAGRPDFAKAIETVRSLGVQLVETKLPEFPYGPVIGTIISSEASSIFEPLIQSGNVDQLADQKQIAGLKAGLEITAKDYLKAMRIRSLMQEGMRTLFDDIDVLLAPSRLAPAPKITQPLDRPSSDRPTPKERGLTALIPAGNLAGLPALSLPCGFADGMPIAIQLVGRPFSENLLLTLGKFFQEKTDWHKRRPGASEPRA